MNDKLECILCAVGFIVGGILRIIVQTVPVIIGLAIWHWFYTH